MSTGTGHSQGSTCVVAAIFNMLVTCTCTCPCWLMYFVFSKYSTGCAVIGNWYVIISCNMINFPGQSRTVALRAEMRGYVLVAKKSEDAI